MLLQMLVLRINKMNAKEYIKREEELKIELRNNQTEFDEAVRDFKLSTSLKEEDKTMEALSDSKNKLAKTRKELEGMQVLRNARIDAVSKLAKCKEKDGSESLSDEYFKDRYCAAYADSIHKIEIEEREKLLSDIFSAERDLKRLNNEIDKVEKKLNMNYSNTQTNAEYYYNLDK